MSSHKNIITFYKNCESIAFLSTKERHIKAFGDVELWFRIELSLNRFYEQIDERLEQEPGPDEDYIMSVINQIMRRLTFYDKKADEAKEYLAINNPLA